MNSLFPSLPSMRPGQTPTADEWNRMREAIERVSRLVGGSGVAVRTLGDQLGVVATVKDTWLAKITAGDSGAGYTWVEVQRVSGAYAEIAGRSGSPAGLPGFEANGDTGIGANSIVLMWLAGDGISTEFVCCDDAPESCTEFAVRCANGQLITRFMRGRFTVSDTPCGGLGGGGGGGPGGGGGGGPGAGGGTTPPIEVNPEWHWCHDPVLGWYQLPVGTPCPDGSGGGGGTGMITPGGTSSPCPPGTYWGYSESYGGWACIPLMGGSGTGGIVRSSFGALGGGPGLGGGGILGGNQVVDYSLPIGTTSQVLSWDSGGTPTPVAMPAGGAGTTLALAAYTADANNSGTSETDLYTTTLDAGQLAADGDAIEVNYTVTTAPMFGSTCDIRLYFGGTNFNTITTTMSLTAAIRIRVTRVSSTAVRVETLRTISNPPSVDCDYDEITGLTLSNTQVVKVTGQNSSGSNEITARMGSISYTPAP